MRSLVPAPFLLCSLTSSALAVPSRDYAALIETAPHRIGTAADVVLRDPKRGAELHVRVNWPVSDGPFPVVIFSHGAWGSKDGYLALTERWARHGYVTLQPDHRDARTRGVTVGDRSVFGHWQERPADVSFLIDALADLEQKLPALKGKIDRGRVGVAGHSYGANTAQLVAGARARLRTGEKSFADPRVQAAVLLSGQGPGEMLTERSWETVRIPMLVMTGSRDGPTRTGQPAEWRRKPYELSPPGGKYLVWVDGMDHGFGGLAGLPDGLFRFRKDPDHVRITQIATLAFWDAHLKGDPDAVAYLRSDRLRRIGGASARVEWK